MRPVTFESSATFKFLALSLVASIPSAYLVIQGNYYNLLTPPDPQTALVYLMVGAPCLVIALIFMARVFARRKIIVQPALIEIKVGNRGNKIRWESIRSISYSPLVGLGSIYIRTDRKTFRFTRFDFPNLSTIFEVLQDGLSEKSRDSNLN